MRCTHAKTLPPDRLRRDNAKIAPFTSIKETAGKPDANQRNHQQYRKPDRLFYQSRPLGKRCMRSQRYKQNGAAKIQR